MDGNGNGNDHMGMGTDLGWSFDRSCKSQSSPVYTLTLTMFYTNFFRTKLIIAIISSSLYVTNCQD